MSEQKPVVQTKKVAVRLPSMAKRFRLEPQKNSKTHEQLQAEEHQRLLRIYDFMEKDLIPSIPTLQTAAQIQEVELIGHEIEQRYNLQTVQSDHFRLVMMEQKVKQLDAQMKEAQVELKQYLDLIDNQQKQIIDCRERLEREPVDKMFPTLDVYNSEQRKLASQLSSKIQNMRSGQNTSLGRIDLQAHEMFTDQIAKLDIASDFIQNNAFSKKSQEIMLIQAEIANVEVSNRNLQEKINSLKISSKNQYTVNQGLSASLSQSTRENEDLRLLLSTRMTLEDIQPDKFIVAESLYTNSDKFKETIKHEKQSRGLSFAQQQVINLEYQIGRQIDAIKQSHRLAMQINVDRLQQISKPSAIRILLQDIFNVLLVELQQQTRLGNEEQVLVLIQQKNLVGEIITGLDNETEQLVLRNTDLLQLMERIPHVKQYQSGVQDQAALSDNDAWNDIH